MRSRWTLTADSGSAASGEGQGQLQKASQLQQQRAVLASLAVDPGAPLPAFIAVYCKSMLLSAKSTVWSFILTQHPGQYQYKGHQSLQRALAEKVVQFSVY